ncbi:MAG: family 10 glycosylhydrolase, partial [Opitutales bacterium]|nr:family 10 glycosylhydrolase [Opitutales bacterium]
KAYLKSSPPPIAKTHPEWYTRDHAGKIQHELDPGVPAVQDHLIAVIEECIQNYDVDGINLDYIRYFGEDRGYNPWAMKRFFQQTSIEGRPEIEDPAWSQFKRDQVSDFVRRCATTVWSIRPTTTFSVNAVGWGSAPRKDFSDTQPYYEAMQDWAGWIKQGWVDAVLQMSYKREWEADQKLQYRNWSDYTQKLTTQSESRVITMGIGGYFNPLDDALNQYREATKRNLGTSLFAYDRPTKEAAEGKGDKQGPDSKIWDKLRTEIYPEPISAPTPDWREHLSMIAGYLVDDTGTPMDNVVISLDSTGYSAKTDGSGFVAFTGLPPGTYQLSSPGHEIDGSTIETTAGNVAWITED